MGSTATRRGRGRHVGSMSNTDRRGDRHGWLVVEARVAHGKSLCVLLIMWSCSFQLYKLHVCIIRMWHILDAFVLSVDTAFLSVYPPPLSLPQPLQRIKHTEYRFQSHDSIVLARQYCHALSREADGKGSLVYRLWRKRFQAAQCERGFQPGSSRGLVNFVMMWVI